MFDCKRFEIPNSKFKIKTTPLQKSTHMLTKNISALQDHAEAIQQEWLETNGLGGWSGSTILCANTRRYHGLLVAAVVPPAERMVLVSKLDETIIIDDNRFELGTNNYGNAIYPTGYKYLTNFTKDLFPEFVYEAGDVTLKKTIGMIHGENTVVIRYEVLSAKQPFTLELLPLLAARGYHKLVHMNDAINRNASFDKSIFQVRLYNDTPEIFMKAPAAKFQADPDWYYNFNYPVEQYRGLDFTEDLFSPGRFTVELKQGDSLGLILSTENPAEKDAAQLLAGESLRRQTLLNEQPTDEMLQQLILAADQFIVKRGENLKTIIAGYPWFTDWGRDTMISLPGLCLSTGRYEDAKKILGAFAQSLSMGMLPNRFQDNREEPEYNNADGTLWYFIAIHKYLVATQDGEFVINELLPVLKEIVDWHFAGTRYDIHVDDDGLLYAGEKGQQLTWMDAKVGDWVVTPRMGKPVEIQALWYNALKIFSGLLELNGQADDAAMVNLSAEKAKKSFIEKFWYAEGHYLYDTINENGNADASLRPNQLFAMSLPFPLVEGDDAKIILRIIEEDLYTPVGLRTLPKSDTRYIPVYGGNVFQRDSAYHQGTVWSWLLGSYVDALVKIKNQKEKARKVIEDFAYHLNEGCIGSVSEIFDADPPHHPRGCVAQAWGVAEILRVMKDYELYEVKNKKAELKKEIAGIS
jgi:predicted glycogen debranching enzyme